MRYLSNCVRWLFVPGIALLLCGCPYVSDVPLSARDEAEIDSALVGEWRFEDTQKKTLWTLEIYQFNDREFLVMNRGEGEDDIELYRAFVTHIGGERFLNVQELEPSDVERTWAFANYAIKKDELAIRLVEEKLFKEKIASSEVLRKFIERNLQNKELYEEDETVVFTRVTE